MYKSAIKAIKAIRGMKLTCSNAGNRMESTGSDADSRKIRYAFVDITGEDAEEKALRLNGSAAGGRNLVVKVMPPSNEYCQGTPEMYVSLAEGLEKQRLTPSINVVMVTGFDIWLPEDDVKDPQRKFFSACGEIWSVHVGPESYIEDGRLHDKGILYIVGLRDEVAEKAMALDGTDMGGWNVRVVGCSGLGEVNFSTYGAAFPER